MRAARAEVRRTRDVDSGLCQCALFLIDPLNALLDLVAHVELGNAARDHARNHRWGQLERRRQQPVTMRTHPFALGVELADHLRAHIFLPVVELLFQLIFEHLPLFFDDEDFLQPRRELMHAFRLQRPHHAHLEHPQADGFGELVVNAQIFQRLPHIQVGLAGRHDAQARTRRINHDVIQFVYTGVVNRHVNLVVVHELFLLKRRVRPADIDAAFRQGKVIRDDRLHAVRVHDHAGGRFHRIGHRLHAHIAAGITAHGVAMHAEIEIFLHARRIQHRHHRADELMIGLVRQRGRLGAVVIACNQQHTAVLAGARVIAMLEHVTAAVHARPLAVPHGEHAVVLGVRVKIELLRAPHGGGTQFLVDARHKLDVRFFEVLFRFPRVLVNRAEWRATIAGNETASVEPGPFVDLPLQHHQAQQRLRAVHVDAPRGQRKAVVERDVLDGPLHGLR